MRRLLWALVSLALLLGSATQTRAACGLTGYAPGFNLPGTPNNNYGLTVDELKQELAIMAGLGVRYVRIFYLPCAAGFGFTNYNKMTQTIQNTLDQLVIFRSYGIKAIISLDVGKFVTGSDFCDVTWQDFTSDWPTFVQMTARWEKALINGPLKVCSAVHVPYDCCTGPEAGSCSATGLESSSPDILYYDLWNEVASWIPPPADAAQFVTGLVNGPILPEARRGLSLLDADDASWLKTTLDTGAPGKTLRYIDTHSYPESCWGFGEGHQWYGTPLSTVAASFPSACLVAGEFAGEYCPNGCDGSGPLSCIGNQNPAPCCTGPGQGSTCPKPWELGNASTEQQQISQTISAGARVALGWLLWDYDTSGDTGCNVDPETGLPIDVRWGLGFNANLPRDAYGKFINTYPQVNRVSDGDFETAATINPWAVGCSGCSTPQKTWNAHSANFNGGTGSHFLHLSAASPDIPVYICSPSLTVSPSSTSIAITVNARTTAPNGAMTIDLHYGSTMMSWPITGLNGSTFTNVQTLDSDGFVFRNIPAGQTSVQVCFVGYPTSGCGGGTNLDIDDLSVHDF